MPKQVYNLLNDKADMNRFLVIISFLFMSLQLFAQRQIIYSPEIEAAANNGDAEAQYIMGCILTTMNVGIPLDENRGTEYLKKSDAAGCPMGTWQLGMSYHNGSGVTKDETKATELFKKSISGLKKLSKTNPLASELLGESYEGGYGVSPKIKTGIEYFTKAAENGNAFAMRELSLLYYSGEEIEADNALAKGWLLKAVNAGDPVAMYWMADFYERGEGGFDKNDQQAKDMYLKAAKAGVPAAMNRVGVIYDDEEKYEEAIKWYNLAVSFKNADAMFNLGVSYEDGTGIEENIEKANELFQKSAEAGKADAMARLGHNYINGIGLPESPNIGVEWIKKATKEDVPQAWYDLGWCYEEGIGVAQNETSAAGCYLKAAELGYVDAMCEIGNMYREGIGVDQSDSRAKNWYLKAANSGDAEGWFYLGFMNQEKGNYKDAMTLFHAAAKGGDRDAMHYLGLNYLRGNGCSKEYKEAIKWFTNAANAGNADSMHSLGILYAYGTNSGTDDIPVDLEKATDWLQKAVDAGDESAKEELNELVLYHNKTITVTQPGTLHAEFQKVANIDIDKVVQLKIRGPLYDTDLKELQICKYIRVLDLSECTVSYSPQTKKALLEEARRGQEALKGFADLFMGLSEVAKDDAKRSRNVEGMVQAEAFGSGLRKAYENDKKRGTFDPNKYSLNSFKYNEDALIRDLKEWGIHIKTIIKPVFEIDK